MATGKTFYWIRLKVNFMTSDKVDFLMSQKDGANYVVLYQMLCLNTINNGGELSSKLGEMIIPFDENKIQRDCKHFSIDTIRVALELYKKLGMIYINDNSMLQIANFEEMVGKETDYARQKRLQRKKTKQIEYTKDSDVDIVHTEIRDKSLEFRDKSLDTRDLEKEKEREIEEEKKAVALQQLESEFETLWKLYPRKKGKEKAKKSYVKARKEGTTFEEVQNGLDSFNFYNKELKTDIKFIPHGSTWFNQKLWTDDNTIKKEKTAYDILEEIGNEETFF